MRAAAIGRPLAAALRLLTVLPLPGDGRFSPVELGRSALAYPAVGVLIGGVLAMTATLLHNVSAGGAAAIVLALWVLITGALHLDGLADCADGWLGGHGAPERIRRIMHDPHVGSAAVVAVTLLLIGKFAALEAVLAAGRQAPLWLAPVLGRTVVLGLMLTTPYASPGGMASATVGHLPRTAATVLAAALAALGLLIAPAATLIAMLVACLMWHGLRRLGGASGDGYGAAVELTETSVLLAMC